MWKDSVTDLKTGHGSFVKRRIQEAIVQRPLGVWETFFILTSCHVFKLVFECNWYLFLLIRASEAGFIMGGPQYKRSKSFSLQGSHMTVTTPWANMKLVPVSAHTCLTRQTNTAYLTLLNLCFYATPFAKNVLLHLNDKCGQFFVSNRDLKWPIISSVYNGNVVSTQKLIKHVLMHIMREERSNISSCDSVTLTHIARAGMISIMLASIPTRL